MLDFTNPCLQANPENYENSLMSWYEKVTNFRLNTFFQNLSMLAIVDSVFLRDRK